MRTWIAGLLWIVTRRFGQKPVIKWVGCDSDDVIMILTQEPILYLRRPKKISVNISCLQDSSTQDIPKYSPNKNLLRNHQIWLERSRDTAPLRRKKQVKFQGPKWSFTTCPYYNQKLPWRTSSHKIKQSNTTVLSTLTYVMHTWHCEQHGSIASILLHVTANKTLRISHSISKAPALSTYVKEWVQWTLLQTTECWKSES